MDKNDITNRLSSKTVDELITIRQFAVGRIDTDLVHLCDKEIARRDPLGLAFWASVAAYEQLLTEKNGKTTKATRVRNKLNRLGGTIEAMTEMLEQWALDPVKVGFENLLEAEKPEQMAEHIVAYRFPDRFSERAVESAKAKLDKYGITPL